MRLSDRAYEVIKHKIITLEIPPMAAIEEQELMNSLQLGRTPIREALQRLAAQDLVKIVPRRGIFATDISITDLQQIYELRLVLEGFCARMAARRITPAELAHMQELVRELERVPQNDQKRLMAIDAQFHQALYHAAHNEFLTQILDRLNTLSFRIFYLVLGRIGSFRAAVEQHVEVTQALAQGDGPRAEAIIQQHIVEFQEQIKAAL